MELRHLRYFVAVAKDLHFTRAAARLHIAQPALSVQIRQLETEVGAKLLIREGRNVHLTEAGRVFLERAHEILNYATRSISLARQAANGETGNLQIAFHTAAEFQIFPKIISSFQRQWPKLHLNFQNIRTREQLERLLRGELDIGFIRQPPIEMEAFDMEALAQETFVAVLPVEHKLASQPEVSIFELSKEPFVSFPRAHDPELFDEIEQLFWRAGAAFNVAYELENLLSVVNFVRMINGYSILPNFVEDVRIPGVTCRPLKSENVVNILYIVKKKNSGPLANSFYEFALDCYRS
jgi:DNA-binding transcriptional LysR family regulator